MRCWLLAQGCLFLTLCLAASAADPRFVPGQILVKPRAGLSESEFAARLRVHGARHRLTLQRLNVRVLNLAEGRAEAVLAALRQDPGIEFAERDGIARAAFLPNDPYVLSGNEWHLAKIQAPQAWDLTTGSTNTVVAILDSGINAGHPDLAGRVLPGYDFLYNGTDTSDDFGHGTAVAGVVVAAGDNGLGVAGVAYGCSVLPVRVVDTSGFASYSSIAQGIRYAVDQGVRVINISIAGNSPSSTMQDAINYAWSNNVLVVAAAGNNANSVPQYPAACDHVVAVAATASDDSLASFSSYGSFVALSAPGDNIWTTQSDLSNPYGAWRGTSFASPMVAATAALVASLNPSLGNTQIISLLEQNADDLGAAGYDLSFGYGRLNVLRALTTANPGTVPLPPAPETPPIVSLASPAAAAEFTLGATVALAANAAADSGSITSVVFLADGSAIGSCSAAPFGTSWTPGQPGSHWLTALATDSQGLCATSAPVMIQVSVLEAAPPRMRITNSPPNGARLESPDVWLAGTASDSAGIDHVEVQVNNAPVAYAAGTTNWSAQVSLTPGTNLVRVRCVDEVGNVSPDITRALTYVVTSPITVQTNGVGRVTPDLNGSQLEIGRVYHLRAVPGPGQVFAGWDGVASQSPGLAFVMQSNLNLVANFVANPFPAVKGTYTGLVANTNGVTPDNSGYFTLTVTTMGSFSGRLLNGGQGYGFHGQFNLAGDTTVTVRRGVLGPLAVTLHVNLTNSTDQVSGCVTDGAWISELAGDRNVFNARWNPAQQAGLRAFILKPADATTNVAARGSSRISTSGSASVRGRLCDGRAFGTASSLAKTGDYPLYLALNRGSEVVIGWLNFPAGQVSAADGTVLWVKSGTNAFSAALQAAAAQ